MYHSAYIAALQSLTVAVNAARPSVFQRGLEGSTVLLFFKNNYDNDLMSAIATTLRMIQI